MSAVLNSEEVYLRTNLGHVLRKRSNCIVHDLVGGGFNPDWDRRAERVQCRRNVWVAMLDVCLA